MREVGEVGADPALATQMRASGATDFPDHLDFPEHSDLSDRLDLPDRADVVVVGGGTAGLTTALILGRAGHRVVVLERRRRGTSARRGEILQPNGLAVLHALGLTPVLMASPHAETHRYHFLRIGRGLLCTFDYRELDTFHATTRVLLPEVLNGILQDAVAELPRVTVHRDAAVTDLGRDGADVTGVVVGRGDHRHVIAARLVVGADGVGSRVRRALGSARVMPYSGGYLTGIIPRSAGVDGEGHYFLGRGEILGLFPVSAEKLYFFYLMDVSAVAGHRAQSVNWLRDRMRAIHPALGSSVDAIQSWDDLTFHPCTRVIADRWTTGGCALVGDAAHAINPHTAQGRNLALEDVAALSDIVLPALACGNGPIPASVVSAYAAARQNRAAQMARLGDELVLFWNAKNPLFTFARDRAFCTMARSPVLRQSMHAHIAGLPVDPPGPWARLRMGVGW